MIRYLSLILALAVCLGASVAGAATELPYVEDFEGSWTLTAPWDTNDPSGSVSVQSTNVLTEDIDDDGTDGTQSLEANMCNLELSIDPAEDATNVWFQVYAKATPYSGSDPTVPVDDVAAFFIDETGDVKAMNGGSWQTFDTNLDTDDWHGFAVQLNFHNDADEWDIFLSSDSTYGTAFEKLNTLPLSFGSSCTSNRLTKFEVQGIALLDAVAAQEDSKFQSKDNLIVKALDLDAEEQVQLGLFPHGYNSSNDNLDENSELGDDLRQWLEIGDFLALYAGASPLEYERYNDTDGWNQTSGTITDPSDVHIDPGTAVWVEKGAGNTLPYVAFMDFNDLGATVHKTVKGTSEDKGMNFLTWDKPAQSASLGNSGGAGGFGSCAGSGDKMYKVDRSGKAPNGVKRLVWNAAGYWMEGGSASSDTFAPGEVFWYYRGSDTDPGTWDLDAAQ